MKNVPDVIYLQIDPENEDCEDFSELDTTYCEDKINEKDLKYLLSTPSRENVDLLLKEILAFLEQTHLYENIESLDTTELLKIISIINGEKEDGV